MRRALNVLLLIVFVGGVGFVAFTYRTQVIQVGRQIETKFTPCRSPITYSLGSIDTRFGISKMMFTADLKEAESIWEKSSGKDLFEYTAVDGDVTVNLVYDARQASTDRLKTAGIQIDRSKASYDSLKAQYDSHSANLKAEQVQYERAVATYKSHEASYNAQVQSWNGRGGAPSGVYEQLQQQQRALQQEVDALHVRQARLNGDVDTVNALATALNQLIVQLNLNVQQYNQTGASQGEFEEGLYESDAGVQKIDIYEYSSHNALVRVLAHEMGHALGLGHVTDTEAIMYKINQGKGLALTKSDIAELDAVCNAGIF